LKDDSEEFNKTVAKILPWFEAEAYAIDMKVKTKKAVKSARIRFPGLLYELDLSPRQGQVLSIRIELDSRPPGGGAA
jgi:hypothetical protein